MTEQGPVGTTIGKVYDAQAVPFRKFTEGTRDKYLSSLDMEGFRLIRNLCHPNTRVLDIGCGSGDVARWFIFRGISPQNIIGIDVSGEQLKIGRKMTPGVTFLKAPADDFNLPDGSVDLVTTCTVLHHLDDEQLGRMLERIYNVLSSNGTYFFVEVDPDHSDEGRDPRNTGQWTSVRTPWGGEVPFSIGILGSW